MIILIQTAVIIVALGLVLSVLAGRQTHSAKAWKKVALCLLAVAMVVAVLFPDTTNVLAHTVGVGRGADLLLYILTLTFIGYIVNDYLRQQADREVIHRLARKLAIYEAKNRKKVDKQ